MPSGRQGLGIKARVHVRRFSRCIVGGRSIISAIKAPVDGSSKCVALVTTDFPVAVVTAFFFFLLGVSARLKKKKLHTK